MHIVLLEVNFHLKYILLKIFCPTVVHKIKLFPFDWAEVNSLHRWRCSVSLTSITITESKVDGCRVKDFSTADTTLTSVCVWHSEGRRDMSSLSIRVMSPVRGHSLTLLHHVQFLSHYLFPALLVLWTSRSCLYFVSYTFRLQNLYQGEKSLGYK